MLLSGIYAFHGLRSHPYQAENHVFYWFITAAATLWRGAANDPDEVIIDFAESRVVDMSAIEALNKITERYHKVGKKVHLKHLSKDCKRLLKNAESIIDVNVMEDPTYKVLTDQL